MNTQYTYIIEYLYTILYEKEGSIQSLDWTSGLDWWTVIKIICMPPNQNTPVGYHFETKPLSFMNYRKNI